MRYYIEAGDADGNVATDPVDAPYTTHRFRIEWYPSLLADNFGDPNPYNVLGGWSGIFKDPDEGGVITPCYDGDVLRLTFDVTDHLPDLDAFTLITNWSAMESFTLAAEERIGSGSGTIYIDDVNFEPDAWPIQLDNFNDLDNQNGLGLLHDIDLGSGASLDVGYDQTNPYGSTGASLVLTYHVPNGSYAAWHSGLGGLDASSYDKLAFVVRGANGEENFHVWLVDQEGHSGWVEVISYTTIANTWPSTPVEIPLQDFAAKDVDLTQLSLFKIAFEWEGMSGTVYLDDIRFTLPPPPVPLSIEPASAPNDIATPVTITGTNFTVTPTVAVGFVPLPNVTRVDSETLTALVPPNIASGLYNLLVV